MTEPAFARPGTVRTARTAKIKAVHGRYYDIRTGEGGRVWTQIGTLTPLASLRVDQKVALFWDDFNRPWIVGAFDQMFVEMADEAEAETVYIPPSPGFSLPDFYPQDLLPAGDFDLGSADRQWKQLHVEEIFLDGEQLFSGTQQHNLLYNSSLETEGIGSAAVEDWVMSHQTALSSSILLSEVTSLTVDDGALLDAGGGYLRLGEEWIEYASAAGDVASTLTRGLWNTMAKPHSKGCAVLCGATAIPEVVEDYTAHGQQAVILPEDDWIKQDVYVAPNREVVFSVDARRYTTTTTRVGGIALEWRLPGGSWQSPDVYRGTQLTSTVKGDGLWYRYHVVFAAPLASSNIEVRIRSTLKRIRIDRAMVELVVDEGQQILPSIWLYTAPSTVDGGAITKGTIELGGEAGAALSVWDVNAALVTQILVDEVTGGRFWTTYAGFGGTVDDPIIEINKDGSITGKDNCFRIYQAQSGQVFFSIKKGGITIGTEPGPFVGIGSQWAGIRANIAGGMRFFWLNIQKKPYHLWVGDNEKYMRFSVEKGLELHGDAMIEGTLQVNRIILPGEVSQGFLSNDEILMLTQGDAWAAEDATGTRMWAGGFAGKRDGEQQFLADAAIGEWTFGEGMRGRINKTGIQYLVDNADGQMAQFSFKRTSDNAVLGGMQGLRRYGGGDDYFTTGINAALPEGGNCSLDVLGGQMSGYDFGMMSMSMHAYNNVARMASEVWQIGSGMPSRTKWLLGYGGQIMFCNSEDGWNTAFREGFVAVFDGPVAATHLEADTLFGMLQLKGEVIDCDEDYWDGMPINTVAVVQDAEGGRSWRIKTATREWKADLTEVT